MKRAYEYRHVAGFEETSLAGNVYYVNHLRWQGRCREMFLRDHASEVMRELSRDLSLATVRCSCEYFAEINAFSEVILRMRLVEMVQNRITLSFEYWVFRDGQEELAARGEQQIACMRREQGRLTPSQVPTSLREALAPYNLE